MATTETESEPCRTYRGNCHCGAFVYELEAPEIKSASECNCSICHKKGYLWVFPRDFKVVKGSEDALTAYTFGSKTLTHKFCPTCATPLMGWASTAPPGKQRAVNIHALQDFNTWELKKSTFDGAALGNKYVPPEHKGALPEAFEGSKLYTGGCHCGAVSVAVQSKPLDETHDDKRVECNCSICERNGYYWIYPETARVVLAGDEARVGRYCFAQHMLSKTFCRTCGVNLTNEYKPWPEERRANMTEGERFFENHVKSHHPVNARVLTGVDLGGMKPPARLPGATEIQPPYKNP